MEWIGTGNFNANRCTEQEWVITEVAQVGDSAEKHVNKTLTGEGCIFDKDPVQIGEYGFYWKEDRLAEADLSKKMFSQNLADKLESGVSNSSKSNSTVLEVICLNRQVDAVSEIYHYSLQPKSLVVDSLGTPFKFEIEGKSQSSGVNLKLPVDSKFNFVRQGHDVNQLTDGRITIEISDLLHIERDSEIYYFRVVPRVAVGSSRRSIFSDPFYLITTLCLFVGALGFFFMFKNLKTQKKILPPPPRIAVVEVKEIAHDKVKDELKPKPIAETKEIEPEKPPEELPDTAKEKLKKNMLGDKQSTEKEKVVQIIPNQMPSPKQQEVTKPGPLTEKNKGSLANDATISKNNVVGFLSGIKKPKTMGLIKADQILAKGVVSETVSGKSAEVFLDQSAQGLVNKDTHLTGENLAAATTKLNLKDQVGKNSLDGAERDALKHGFNISYGEGSPVAGAAKDNELAIETSVEGGLDRASVKAAIKGYSSEIRTCYERALRVKSTVNGRIVFKFQVGAEGNVQWVQILNSSVDSPTLATCVQEVIKVVKFPVAKKGQDTIVIYPFQFNKKGT
jgi:hypothetical protein